MKSVTAIVQTAQMYLTDYEVQCAVRDYALKRDNLDGNAPNTWEVSFKLAENGSISGARVEAHWAGVPLRPASEWHEDDGNVLWYTLPIVEPPYCGSALDVNFPSGLTHWTPLPTVELPR